MQSASVGSPRNGLSVTRMSQLHPNSSRRPQRIVLGVRVYPRRDRRIRVTEPLRDHGQRHTAQMQRRSARVARIVQPDRTHTRRLRQLVPHPRQRIRRVRLPCLIHRHIPAVGMRFEQHAQLNRIGLQREALIAARPRTRCRRAPCSAPAHCARPRRRRPRRPRRAEALPEKHQLRALALAHLCSAFCHCLKVAHWCDGIALGHRRRPQQRHVAAAIARPRERIARQGQARRRATAYARRPHPPRSSRRSCPSRFDRYP